MSDESFRGHDGPGKRKKNMKNMDSEVERQEKIIASNHSADTQNGLTESQASESDAFERRVLGTPDGDESWDYSFSEPEN